MRVVRVVYGCFGPDSQHRLWILMELCDYGSITDIMEQFKLPLTEPQIAYVIASTMNALDYLHNTKHIIHRDVKGRNLLLTKYGGMCTHGAWMLVYCFGTHRFFARVRG